VERPRNLTVIIKPAGNQCNLKCKYCFFNPLDQQKDRVMSEQMLEKFIREYLAMAQKSATFIWHGGEPLMAGIGFYETALEMQKKFNVNNVKIKNDIQTNATFISNDWIRLFTENHFRIGISFDGSSETHGRFRVYPTGTSSFKEVVRGVRLLQEANLKFGVIQVLTKTALVNIEQDFRFFLDELKINSWSVSPFCGEKGCSDFMKAEAMSDALYSEYMEKLIGLWLKENRKDVRIREIDNCFFPSFGKKPNICSHSGSCNRFFCVEYDGNIYPCGRFSGQEEYLFGNIKEGSLAEILTNKKCQEYYRDAALLSKDCQMCEWKVVCNNGCTYLRSTPKTKYVYCQAQKKMFEMAKQLVGGQEAR